MAVRQDELAALSGEVDLDRDRALVERCQGGDSSAFGDLYSRYYDRLFRFCLRRLHDRDEAEDATQEAFARAWRALPNFVGERRFYPWLTVIAGNVCTDILRRRFRSSPTSDVEMAARHGIESATGESSEELVLAAVDGELVVRAMDRLSPRHRQVLNMRETSGWTYQQIATHEGVEIGTIETLLWRARQALKREFTVLSETKTKLAGLALGGTALFRRIAANAGRKADVVRSTGATFGVREAVIAAAITGVAVTAAVVSPNHSPTAASSAAKVASSLPAVVSPTTAPSPASAPTVPQGTNLTSGGALLPAIGANQAPLNLGTSSPSNALALGSSSQAPSHLSAGNGLNLPSANAATPGLAGLSLAPTNLLSALTSLTTAVETLTNAVTQQVTTLVSGALSTVGSVLGGQPLTGGGSLTPGGQLGTKLFGQGLVDLALSLLGGNQASTGTSSAPINTSANKSTSSTPPSTTQSPAGSAPSTSSGTSSSTSTGSSTSDTDGNQTPPADSGSTPSS